jgi:hypothetical protein
MIFFLTGMVLLLHCCLNLLQLDHSLTKSVLFSNSGLSLLFVHKLLTSYTHVWFIFFSFVSPSPLKDAYIFNGIDLCNCVPCARRTSLVKYCYNTSWVDSLSILS